MSNGQWMGEPARQHWSIELPDRFGFESVHADKCRVDGGALVFTNGDLFAEDFVTAYAPHAYQTVFPQASASETGCGGCQRREEGDE